MSEEYLLKATGITKSFSGNQVLSGVGLCLKKGTVHALCGGNGAGKSTFLKILMGLHQADSGEVLVSGRRVDFKSPADALEAGISIITQELEPVPDMTVAENIFLGREPKKVGLFVDFKMLNAQAKAVLDQLDLDISPKAKMHQLSLAQIQLVEIAKALSYNSDIIIMDEPTSAIGEQEAQHLFSAIEGLKARGVGIVYVSHRMNEIFQIADEYTVLRDGRLVESGSFSSIDRAHLVRLIVGRELKEEWAKHNIPTDELVFSVNSLSRKGEFEKVSFDVNRGEIVGIFGLMGAGRSELLNSIFGVKNSDSGTVTLGGRKLSIRCPSDAILEGLALVTEDRKESGLDLTKSVRENISLASLASVSKNGFVSRRRERAVAKEMIDQFSIKTHGQDIGVSSLSGGNQQKVVFSKWMRTSPCVLLLDEPTRGVDVGAKRDIYNFISDFAAAGNAVVMVSSEIPEIMGMSDRVVVLRRGSVSGTLGREELTQEKLASLAS